ncbi:MAG: DUF4224 domain-containing protein [Burkholderiaceae bacterium]|nr:MAG: DUF4224 domain-containing protein [Burkholderiaceae bacterium]
MSTLFLNDEELATLTGRRLKSRQIEWLRATGIPFRVNATGHPVVTRGAIEGRKEESTAAQHQRWVPRVFGAHGHGT